MTKTNAMLRIAVLYDGGCLQAASDYLRYGHSIHSRLSLEGLHRFVERQVANEEGVPPKFARVIEAHYFRGRYSIESVIVRDKLENERRFDDVLMRAGIITHFLPRMAVHNGTQSREIEKGIDVWFALEAMELAVIKGLDVIALFATDGDYVPLIRKLNANGVRVLLLAWNFEFYSEYHGEVRLTKTPKELADAATYTLDMCQIIDRGLKSSRDDDGVRALFLPRAIDDPVKNTIRSNSTSLSTDSSRRRGRVEQIISGKGYGFIAEESAENHFFSFINCESCEIGELKLGDCVTFEVGPAFNPKYKTQAIRVRRAD